MLVTSFEQFHGKYLPSFIAAQKFAFPLLVSSLGLIFLVFFEPEQIKNTKVMTAFRVFFLFTLGLFVYYIVTLDQSALSWDTELIFGVQTASLVVASGLLFYLKPDSTQSSD